MDVKDRILIVEDDRSIRNFFRTILEANRYDVTLAENGQEGYSLITSLCPDLVILDLGLPDLDGMEILRRVREWSSLPVVVISARSHERDKVEALDLGADDYITKPFGTPEMLARIRAAIRHSRLPLQTGGGRSGTFAAKGLLIDYDKHRAYIGGQDIGLTQNEFKLVGLLGKYAGKVLTYDFLIREIWGPNMENNNRILRVNMANIRRKMEKNPAQPEYIFTEIGVGYRMVEPDEERSEQ
ncbi:MAG: response regulator transcription factor [Eubacteriales bacterium]|nr:response regulator transcription factor [Eubacteriales bacterium]